MKATVETLNPARVAEREIPMTAVFAELFKARLTALVLLTTMVGVYLGWKGPWDVLKVLHTLLGTAWLASGAAALNQLIERHHDALMQRTENRPLPSGRLSPTTVFVCGTVLSLLGVLQLAFFVNTLTCLLGVATLISYLFIYTPLKRVTSLNTAIGAVPGAIPPLMGWTAARNEFSPEGWSLFAVLFFWQLPHFLAIAWLYREDYARAGFAMLPVIDGTGRRTGRQTVWHTVALFSISLVPAILGLVGGIYFAGALILGALFLLCSVRFALALDRVRARQLFLVSILYLPLLLGLMVLDKVRG